MPIAYPVVCREASPGGLAPQHDALGQKPEGELAKLVMGIGRDSGDLDASSAPGALLRALLGDLLIEYASLTDLEPIGEGGFATVYRAELTHRNGMKQTVAVKKLRPERVQCDEDLKEFIAVCCPCLNRSSPVLLSGLLYFSSLSGNIACSKSTGVFAGRESLEKASE